MIGRSGDKSVPTPFANVGGLRLLRDLFAVGEELERGGVEAKSLTGGRRAVWEDVALVAAASRAANLGAAHAVAVVVDVAEVFLIERRVERRPARAGIKFVFRSKQRQTAKPTRIRAVRFVVEQGPAKRRLGAVVEQDAVLFVVEVLSKTFDSIAAKRRGVVTGFR